MTTRSRRVLVVDDEPDIREILGVYLTRLGYEVLLADTSLGALEMVSTHPPDVVLLDLTMPGVGGEAVITRISREVPVIVITGMDNAEAARDALESGAFDFVAKPFNLNRVRQVIEAAIAKRGESSIRSL